jgi:hypothetical protein
MTNNALAIYDDFARIHEIAKSLASSDLVPTHFQRKPANVLIALEFAHRNNISPFQAMQSIFVVHGRPGLSAAFAISLARKAGVWKKLQYKVEGSGDSLVVTAIATLHDDDKIESSVSMEMAKKAGWTKNAIYASLPEQMLKYRAATFLIRANFPEVLFGMSTVDEIEDVSAAKKSQPVNITPSNVIEAVLEEPKAEEPVPEAIESSVSGEFVMLKGDLLEFILSRSDDWFSVLGKNKQDMLKAAKLASDIPTVKNLTAKLVEYDAVATAKMKDLEQVDA